MIVLREVLGSELRRVRSAQGRTLRDVSSSAAVSLGYLSEVERGEKEASSELLLSICGALHVRLSDLLLTVADRVSELETPPIAHAA
ncbi:MAG: helix-turn-helix domain-containing protein [Candidatus Nanopelagicales bacterium]|nr:helix-turn-helix domain-containing protein [Candidatus Nanopelagicales bacterium]MDP4905769.1 helix-turn-helix domain-containing protein [Candidatus Nanopelagicales bacterium]MDP4975636.1 helix-turn-helix domain-containing protein [Candidatus Nanopelagicales bacterium]